MPAHIVADFRNQRPTPINTIDTQDNDGFFDLTNRADLTAKDLGHFATRSESGCGADYALLFVFILMVLAHIEIL